VNRPGESGVSGHPGRFSSADSWATCGAQAKFTVNVQLRPTGVWICNFLLRREVLCAISHMTYPLC
jgi:hypothetical protein